jgi:hypothetical protein
MAGLAETAVEIPPTIIAVVRVEVFEILPIILFEILL